jgi:lipopolysaccharide transport system permease protein
MQMDQTNSKQIIITSLEDDKRRRKPFGFIVDLFNQFFHLLQYHELIRNLVIRDLKVRYKNSALGVLWSLMNPLLMMIVFTVVFTIMAPVRSASTENYPVFILCGILPWQFFSTSVMGSTVSIVSNAPLIKKVYFPREALPLSVILANLVNFLIALILLFGFILIFRIPLTVWLLYLPVVLLIQLIFTLGIGFFLSTVNVFYRDTQQVMDVVMLAWFFLTPIIYPIQIPPRNYEIFGVTLDVWRLAHILNPMTSLIATYRVILYNGSPPALDFLARTAVTAGAVFLIGWLIFNRYSWRFAEVL